MSMTLIEHIEVGSGGAASIALTSIASDYTDLLVLLSSRSDRAANDFDTLEISFNANTSNRTSRRLYGSGASAASDTFTNGRIGLINASTSTSSTMSSTSIYIPNYGSASAKSASIDGVSENNATTSFQEIFAFLWNDTSAITSLTLEPTNGNFVQYSSATLYGITAGSDGTTAVS